MKTLSLGIAGLGRAFTLSASAFRDPRIEVVAAADPRAEARAKFAAEYRGRAYATVEELCADREVDVVYVATPHELHAQHTRLAASAGKHVLCEKPMALTLEDCRSMIDAARQAGVRLVVGHSHSFDLPIARTAELAKFYGPVRMITALDCTDWAYRPRRPEELAAALQNQASHQVSIARRLAGGSVKTVRGYTASFDPARDTQAAWSCQLGFDNGVFASLVYSGYAHFDSDELMGWIGEIGQRKEASAYWSRRQALRGDELALKNSRSDGGATFSRPQPVAHEHFGFFLVSCEKADLRPMPHGVMIYADAERRLEPMPAPSIPRAEVIDELYGAIVEGREPLHSGEWAMATMEVCLALLRSSREGREIVL
jgi:phthalate 4,5-cis-dihydrodiol dehydrogenase